MLGLLASSISRRRGLVDFCYYVYLTYFLLLPGALQVAVNRFPWDPVVHTEADGVHAAWLIAGVMVAYEIGRLLHRARLRPTSPLAAPIVPNAPLLAFVVIGCLIALATVPLMGGFGVLFSGRDVRGSLNVGNTRAAFQVFLVGQGLALCAMAFALAMLCGRRNAPSPTLGLLALPVAAFAVVITLTLYNPIFNPRFVFFGCFFCLFYMLFRNIFYSTKIWLAMLFPVLLFYVFPVSKFLANFESWEQLWRAMTNRDIDYVLGVDFDTFQWAANTIRFVRNEGLLGIAEVVGPALFFVPRALWPGKPWASSFTVSESLGYWFGNVSMPLYMEFYLAAGLAGSLLGMLAVGWLVARVETGAGIARSGLARVGSDVLVALVGGFTIITLRGPLGGIMAVVGPPIVIALGIVFVLLRRRAADTPMTTAATATRTPPAAAPGGDWRARFAAARRKDAQHARHL